MAVPKVQKQQVAPSKQKKKGPTSKKHKSKKKLLNKDDGSQPSQQDIRSGTEPTAEMEWGENSSETLLPYNDNTNRADIMNRFQRSSNLLVGDVVRKAREFASTVNEGIAATVTSVNKNIMYASSSQLGGLGNNESEISKSQDKNEKPSKKKVWSGFGINSRTTAEQSNIIEPKRPRSILKKSNNLQTDLAYVSAEMSQPVSYSYSNEFDTAAINKSKSATSDVTSADESDEEDDDNDEGISRPDDRPVSKRSSTSKRSVTTSNVNTGKVSEILGTGGRLDHSESADGPPLSPRNSRRSLSKTQEMEAPLTPSRRMPVERPRGRSTDRSPIKDRNNNNGSVRSYRRTARSVSPVASRPGSNPAVRRRSKSPAAEASGRAKLYQSRTRGHSRERKSRTSATMTAQQRKEESRERIEQARARLLEASQERRRSRSRSSERRQEKLAGARSRSRERMKRERAYTEGNFNNSLDLALTLSELDIGKNDKSSNLTSKSKPSSPTPKSKPSLVITPSSPTSKSNPSSLNMKPRRRSPTPKSKPSIRPMNTTTTMNNVPGLRCSLQVRGAYGSQRSNLSSEVHHSNKRAGSQRTSFSSEVPMSSKRFGSQRSNFSSEAPSSDKHIGYHDVDKKQKPIKLRSKAAVEDPSLFPTKRRQSGTAAAPWRLQKPPQYPPPQSADPAKGDEDDDLDRSQGSMVFHEGKVEVGKDGKTRVVFELGDAPQNGSGADHESLRDPTVRGGRSLPIPPVRQPSYNNKSTAMKRKSGKPMRLS